MERINKNQWLILFIFKHLTNPPVLNGFKRPIKFKANHSHSNTTIMGTLARGIPMESAQCGKVPRLLSKNNSATYPKAVTITADIPIIAMLNLFFGILKLFQPLKKNSKENTPKIIRVKP